MDDDAPRDIRIPIAIAGTRSPVWMMPFQDRHADVVARWVKSAEQLKRLAPGTTMPLTGAKVRAWQRQGGRSFVLSSEGQSDPVGYAELNPMLREARHFWLGHVIIAPSLRGKGFGKAFVSAVADLAFQQLRAKRISLIVLPDNDVAIACYRQVGFTPVAEEIHNFQPTQREIRMIRFEITAEQLK